MGCTPWGSPQLQIDCNDAAVISIHVGSYLHDQRHAYGYCTNQISRFKPPPDCRQGAGSTRFLDSAALWAPKRLTTASSVH
jgi:hypothetical protein